MSSTRTTSRRRYDSSGRREQARQTRERIIEVARNLFVTRGYGATPMTAIAEEAGVSVETIYGAYGGKPGLFRALIDVAMRGDADPVPFVEREAIRAIIAEDDAGKQLEMYGAVLADVQPRLAPLARLMRDTAASDPELAEAWNTLKANRLEGMTDFARRLHRRGALRRGMSAAKARDVLWTLNSPEVYDLLVEERGWPATRYGAWVADQLAAALLQP